LEGIKLPRQVSIGALHACDIETKYRQTAVQLSRTGYASNVRTFEIMRGGPWWCHLFTLRVSCLTNCE
jgi:hypothetical protein